MRLVYLVAFIFLSFYTATAQDIIILKTSANQIIAHVLKADHHGVLYKQYQVKDSVQSYFIPADSLLKVVFASGREVIYYYTRVQQVANGYTDKRSSVKVEPFSLLRTSFSSSWDYKIKKGFGFEISAGIIGVGLNVSDEIDPFGVFMKIGPKFMMGSRSQIPTGRYRVTGFYIKPEFMGLTYQYHISAGYSEMASQGQSGTFREYYRVKGKAFILNIGYQVKDKSGLVFDLFGGLGCGIKGQKFLRSTVPAFTGTVPVMYTYSSGGILPHFAFFTKKYNQFFPAFQVGFKIGVLLGKGRNKCK
ncbi:MAG: hypothetical protein K1X81_07415 [Bacteroidia bacterium]|nr:hypothetical protein [Bacteroidia bacterium]